MVRVRSALSGQPSLLRRRLSATPDHIHALERVLGSSALPDLDGHSIPEKDLPDAAREICDRGVDMIMKRVITTDQLQLIHRLNMVVVDPSSR